MNFYLLDLNYKLHLILYFYANFDMNKLDLFFKIVTINTNYHNLIVRTGEFSGGFWDDLDKEQID